MEKRRWTIIRFVQFVKYYFVKTFLTAAILNLRVPYSDRAYDDAGLPILGLQKWMSPPSKKA